MERDSRGRFMGTRRIETPSPVTSTPEFILPANPTVQFLNEEHELPTFQDHLDWLKVRQSKERQRDNGSEFAEVKIRSDAPIGIVLSSDWQLGGRGVDYDLFERHMNMVKNEPNAYMVALSNTIDGYIWPDGIWDEVAHVEEQVEIARTFAKEWKDKLLAVVGSRCHDWTKARGGISPQEMAFLENTNSGMPFFKNGGVLSVDLNGNNFDIAMLHKSRYHSSLNPTNPNKRVHDLRYPADIIAIAHHHVASVEDTYRYEGKYQKEVTFVRTGTYKIDDAYSQSEGFGHGQKGSPMVILRHDMKDWMSFKKMEHGMTVLKMLKQEPDLWGEYNDF